MVAVPGPLDISLMPGIEGACRAMATHLATYVPALLPSDIKGLLAANVTAEPRVVKGSIGETPAIYVDGRDMDGFAEMERADRGIYMTSKYVLRAYAWVREQEFAGTYHAQRSFGRAITAAIIAFPSLGATDTSVEGFTPVCRADVANLKASYSGVSREDQSSRSFAACWVQVPVHFTEFLAYETVGRANSFDVTVHRIPLEA